ncbi:IS110 family transposase [Nocardia sp. N13]|uniref:IS110 family transposase n=1 Tax=Nocardioides sp. N13(2025) TaxID=3453405 RepID=UPI003F760D9E
MSGVSVQEQVLDGAGVVVGVDTHQLVHVAGVIDARFGRLADREFPATRAGYGALVAWAATYGPVLAVGVESTGSYGAGLTRHLLTHGADEFEVFEVSRPEKATRVRHGKSDPVDAYSAAEQVLAGRATGRPKVRTGIVEAIRTIKVPRDAAVENRTAAYSQLRDLITAASGRLHDDLIELSGKKRVAKVLAVRPDPTRIADPDHAVRHALRALARRIAYLDGEIREADQHLASLVEQACPTLLAMPQVGVQTAARLVITAGENIDRMRSEASFAKLTGVAPLPASSGKTHRHRLNPGGDRQANSALYMITVGRMSRHEETRAYVERRRAEGLSTPEIIRCLKRHLARSVYKALRTDLMTT